MNSPYTNSHRNGKIARLPHDIRDELNHWLQDNQQAKTILPWLNSLPQVKDLLASQFDSRPITKQNLSEWKKGGFRDWLIQQGALEFVQKLESQQDLGHQSLSGNFTDKLARWLAIQYAAAANSFASEKNPHAQWNRLREFGADISRLRRADFCSQLLQIKRDRLALDQATAKHLQEQTFVQWAKERGLLPDKPGGVSPEALHDFKVFMGIESGPYVPKQAEDPAHSIAERRKTPLYCDRHAAAVAAAKASSNPQSADQDAAAQGNPAADQSSTPSLHDSVTPPPAQSRSVKPSPGQSDQKNDPPPIPEPINPPKSINPPIHDADSP